VLRRFNELLVRQYGQTSRLPSAYPVQLSPLPTSTLSNTRHRQIFAARFNAQRTCKAATSSASKSPYPTAVILAHHGASATYNQQATPPLCLVSWDSEIRIVSFGPRNGRLLLCTRWIAGRTPLRLCSILDGDRYS